MHPYNLRPPQAIRRNSNKRNGKVAATTKKRTNYGNGSNNRGDGDDVTEIEDGGVENDRDDAFLNHGGPIQQAALRDLRELRQDFLLFLNSSSNIDANNDDDLSSSASTSNKKQQEQQQQRKHHHTTIPRPAAPVPAPAGTAFGIFREVFRSAKVAALHSCRFVASHRCDVNAHAQLLYAACFQLLHESFEEQLKQQPSQQQQQPKDDDDDNARDQHDDGHSRHSCDDGKKNRGPLSSILIEQHAIYAIFCLYALYEINPLPMAPSLAPAVSSSSQAAAADSVDSSILSTLPCGLSNRENPKLVYRRSYRYGIRIDRRGYVLLLQVRELARARIAACQLSSTSSLLSAAAAAAAATDVLLVLERLWSKLVPSEYTGPRGLEGLAGHEDYPFPPPSLKDLNLTMSTKSSSAVAAAAITAGTTANANRNTAKLVQGIMMAASEHAGNDETGSTLVFSDSLQSHLQTYLSVRRAIRLPTFNNANSHSNNITETVAAATATPVTTRTFRLVQERIRKALQPMFDQGQGQRNKEQQQQRQYTDPFLQIVNDNASAMSMMQHDPAATGAGLGAAGDDDSNKPRDLEVGQGYDGLEPSCTNVAIEHKDVAESYELFVPENLPASLLESIQSAIRTLVYRDKDSFFQPQQQPQTATVWATKGRVDDDDDDDGSAASSDDVDNDDGSGGGAGHEALAALIAQAGQTNNTRVTFLGTTIRGGHEDATRGTSRLLQHGGRKSQKQDDDDDDDVSDASSTVGQRALEDLLTITMAMGKSAAQVEQQKQPAEPRKRARKGDAMCGPRKSPRKKNIGAVAEQEDDVDEDSADESEVGDEEEEETAGGEGNAALELLLGRAMM